MEGNTEGTDTKTERKESPVSPQEPGNPLELQPPFTWQPFKDHPEHDMEQRKLALAVYVSENELKVRQAEYENKVREDRINNSTVAQIGKGIVTTLPLLIAVLVAYFSYDQNIKLEKYKSDATAHQAAMKAQADILEKSNAKQSLVYDEAVEVVGTLSQLAVQESAKKVHDEPYKKYRQRFEVLYWSKLPSVEETPAIIKAMDKFRDGLRALDRTDKETDKPASPRSSMNILAINLARAVQAAQKSQKSPADILEDKPTLQQEKSPTPTILGPSAPTTQ